jgi:recombination endonuclease VII
MSEKEKTLDYHRRWRARNRHKTAEYARRYRLKNPEKVLAQQSKWRAGLPAEKRAEVYRRYKYSMPRGWYAETLALQKGLCAICNKPPVPGRKLSVDHNHDTGQVRELLCPCCNSLLGMAKESDEILQRARDYLKKHAQKEEEKNARKE